MSTRNLWPRALSTELIVLLSHSAPVAVMEHFVTAWRDDTPELRAVGVHTGDLTAIQASLPEAADGVPLVVLDPLAAGAHPDDENTNLAERVEDLARAAAALLDDHRLEATEVALTLPALEADITDAAVQATLEALPFSTDCALGLNACQDPVRTIGQLAADGAEHAALRLSGIPAATEQQILLACAEHRLPLSVLIDVKTPSQDIATIVAHTILQLDAALQVGVSAPEATADEQALWDQVAELSDERCLAVRRVLRWVAVADTKALAGIA